MADISSITLPGGGTYDLKDKNAVPKYGKGKNLLNNSYFVGGGTGRGIFPVNQRGQSSYTGLVYGIDRWYSLTTGGILTIGADYITLQAATYNFNWRQTLSRKVPIGSAVTITILKGDGSFVSGSGTLSSSTSFVQVALTSGYIRAYYDYVQITTGANSSNTIKAVWLELGTEQTFYHNEGTTENPVWVLNEIPDYEYELYRCITSTADPSDIYANKVITTNVSKPNLLHNWYWKKPVNQRGATGGTMSPGVYCIDRWAPIYSGSAGTISYTSSGITITPSSGNWAGLFSLQDDAALNGLTLTACVLFSDGTVNYGTITRASGTTQQFTADITLRLMSTGRFQLMVNSTKTVEAVKLEFGTEQTLAHQENGAWVLNEIPDYEYELYRCMTSTADSSDTYANKSLATEQQLAYVETGTTASRNYSAGQPICWSGLFYTADINIVSGTTLSASGGSKNLTETTIGNLLYTSIGYASSSASISSVTGTIVRMGVNYIFNLQIVVGTAIARFIPLVEFSAPTSVRTTVTNPAVWIVNHQAAGTQYAGYVGYANSKHVISSSTQLPVGTYSVYAVVTMM